MGEATSNTATANHVADFEAVVSNFVASHLSYRVAHGAALPTSGGESVTTETVADATGGLPALWWQISGFVSLLPESIQHQLEGLVEYEKDDVSLMGLRLHIDRHAVGQGYLILALFAQSLDMWIADGHDLRTVFDAVPPMPLDDLFHTVRRNAIVESPVADSSVFRQR